MMILLERHTGLAVNPADVSSVVIRSSNGWQVLDVKMLTGERHLVRHTAHCFDSDDIYAVHKQLLEAK
ncbi:hypothetical protein NJH78_05340 [Pseudomonas chlororaphis]|uniref:hypothetical protein n=1 Tax=Pseudomonas chlororaphis TaxID=587753 RepID=UPI00209AC619|nr:hypothetical protein [Pseudomonas chlororaphis]MCO7569390.1 hypothetical protein [Pseudomonas chlororaphis]MCO7586765.1 hypothetical protein [Pseudomonas chlororaphis]